MQYVRIMMALLCSFWLLNAQAQDGNLEDVLYLKNGDVYRGLIVEQVPGESMKIRVAGGSTFTVKITDIQRLTKEEKYVEPAPAPKAEAAAPTAPAANAPAMYGRKRYCSKTDSNYVPHYLKKRSYFFMLELRGGPANGAIRMVNGAKLGRFGFIGVGIGVDRVAFRGWGVDNAPWDMDFSNNRSSGIYLPLYLRYAGDILKKRITPFYYLEAGYAAQPRFPFGLNESNADYRGYGGPLGAAGIGCKFNTRHRLNFNINLNVSWRSNFFRETEYYYDPNGNYSYTLERSGMDSRIFGALGFGLGF